MKVLFLCTNTGVRSRMAAAIVNHFFKNMIKASAAGTAQSENECMFAKIMNEINIDINEQKLTPIENIAVEEYDYIVILCESAVDFYNKYMQYRLGHIVHLYFPDPESFNGNEEEILDNFRNHRDLLKKRLRIFFGAILNKS